LGDFRVWFARPSEWFVATTGRRRNGVVRGLDQANLEVLVGGMMPVAAGLMEWHGMAAKIAGKATGANRGVVGTQAPTSSTGKPRT
jgi:hypothetical protein